MNHLEILPNSYLIPSEIYEPIIPRILHMIWVGSSEPPTSFFEHVSQWRALMPSWTIRVWRNEDIHKGEFPESIVQLIGWTFKGAQKADIMRYFIIEKYGGVYVDADIIPRRSLEDLIVHTHRKVILCHDLPMTWSYIINAFFAATPNHPLFKKACDLCYTILVNTPDIHMNSGPRLLGEAVWKTPSDEPYMMLPSLYFYRNDTCSYSFGTHTYAKNW